VSDRIRVTVTDDRTGEVLGVQFAVDDYVLSICHDFGCTHNPCRCVPRLRSSEVDIVSVLRHLAHPNLAAQWTVLLDAAHEIERLRERADLFDRLSDEGFPDEPYLSGRLRAEIERLEGSA
jgi:hypothetical protein